LSISMCCKCGKEQAFYSYNGEYPLCKNCYRAWMESKEDNEYLREIVGNKKFSEAKEIFDIFFQRWLNSDGREKVQFT
jgi:hypothetical protein